MPSGRVSHRRGWHTAVPTAESGRERFSGGASELLCSGEPRVHRAGFSRTALDSPVPSRGCSGAETVRSHLGPAGSSASQVAAVAWPVRSSLSCCLLQCDQVPVVAWFQRDQAPVVADPDQAPCGQAGSSAWKLPTRPGLSAHARTSRQPCTELPPEAALRGNRATTQSSEAANARPRRGSGNPAAWAGVAMPRYWVCAGDDVVTQHRSGLRTGSSSAIHAR